MNFITKAIKRFIISVIVAEIFSDLTSEIVNREAN